MPGSAFAFVWRLSAYGLRLYNTITASPSLCRGNAPAGHARYMNEGYMAGSDSIGKELNGRADLSLNRVYPPGTANPLYKASIISKIGFESISSCAANEAPGIGFLFLEPRTGVYDLSDLALWGKSGGALFGIAVFSLSACAQMRWLSRVS